MEKFESTGEYSRGIDDRDNWGARENRLRRRLFFKRMAPVILGVASLWGGEHQAIAQSDLPEQRPQETEMFREFGKSRFGLDEITKVGNGVLLGTYAKDRGQMLKKQLVVKYGEAAVEFGFQFEREEIDIAEALEEKIALQSRTDEASKERIAKLDSESNALEVRHAVEELALDSLLEKTAVNNLIGTQHFSLHVDHANGSLFGAAEKTTTKTDRTVQVSYEKYQALAGESETVSSRKMEEMLNEYLSKQGMDLGAVRTHYSFKYLVKDPASPQDRPVYLLVEGVADEGVR